MLCLSLPGSAYADGTNGTLPSVSVQTDQNATMTGSLPGIFTVQRTGDTGQPLVVNYCLGGTATNGMDYQRLSGTVTITAGQSSATIGVTPMGDLAEGIDKNVTVTLVPQSQPFTVVVLPDTQCYTREYSGGSREIFTAQTQWIVDHKDASNIVFVLHEGDITDGNSPPEWTNALTSISLLDGVVPYALAVGNHDGLGWSGNQTALFNQFFPRSRFQNLPTFGGVFESNRMDNCYHLFSASGVDWLVFSLEFGPRNGVLAWANQVTTNYPNRRVIVLTHAHVYSDNTLHGSSTNHLWLPTSYGRQNNGTNVWEKFLRHHANMGFVFNGHICSGTSGRVVGVGDYGNQVFQMMADYQILAYGGAGYLRIVQFFPDQDRMSVKTYSPFLDSWLTDAGNQFVYTNLGVFTNAGAGYLVDTQFASAGMIITNDNVDLTPPGISGLGYAGVPPIIKVTFNEPLETASAQTVTNYSIDKGIHLTSATLLAGGVTVALTTDSDLVPNTLYTLSVNHVKDRAQANNEMSMPATNAFVYVPILLSDDFTNGVLQGWTVVDEGTSEAPSKWLERSKRLIQLSNIYGPSANATNNRKGTFIYWNDPPALGWSNYTFSVTFNTTDDDGVGVMFRYQNPSNYYKVELDAQRSFRKLFKKSGGVETVLATECAGYVPGSNYILRVEVTNSEVTCLLNGAVLFGGPVTDSSLKAGTVALYAWGSQGVFFNNLRVTPLRHFPRVIISSPVSGATITQPDPVSIVVDAFDPDGSIRKVSLFWGTTILAAFTNIPCAFQWTNLPPGSYTLTAQVMDDASQTGVSSPVSFTVAPPPPTPTLTEQPASQSVHSGSSAAFRVQACGPQPLSYQWQFNHVPISVATNTFLLLNNVLTNNAGSYAAIVANQWGSTTSQLATLTVNPSAQPAGGTNGSPAVFFSKVEALDSGVPLVSVNAGNLDVVRIDWSSNCLNWVPLVTLTNYGDLLYFADYDGISHPCRFYRAVAQP
jgi:hypothetical protein